MLHWILQSRPTGSSLGPTVSIEGCEVPTLTVPDERRGEPLAISFDEAASLMAEHPRLYYEPDGSFAWTPTPESRIQGTLVDGRTNLQHIEVWGTPTVEMLNQLGQWTAQAPDTELMFQIVQSGVFLDLSSMQRLLGQLQPG